MRSHRKQPRAVTELSKAKRLASEVFVQAWITVIKQFTVDSYAHHCFVTSQIWWWFKTRDVVFRSDSNASTTCDSGTWFIAYAHSSWSVIHQVVLDAYGKPQWPIITTTIFHFSNNCQYYVNLLLYVISFPWHFRSLTDGGKLKSNNREVFVEAS